jgi:hypothetical protein
MSEPRHLLARLLGTPEIGRLVPRLAPAILQRVIERCGLEASAEIVALASPAQLRRVLDIDLWRAPAPGGDEAFDIDRFGEWLEILLQLGDDTAAERLAAMDFDLVVGGFAGHLAVFEGGTVSGYTTLDGEHIQGRAAGDRPVYAVGGYVVEARREAPWDAFLEILALLHAERPGFFRRLMRACVALSSGERERDGCDALLADRQQQLTDLAAGREARRDARGYVSPAQARAFLGAARAMERGAVAPPLDPVARAWLRDLGVSEVPADEAAAAPSAADAAGVAAVMDVLADEGLLTPPRALLPPAASDATPFSLARELIDSHPTAPDELAFLTNALLSGCGIHSGAFTAPDASDAVLATCNLGLENWPAAWRAPDLVTAFQIGWGLLHRDLCLHATRALIEALGDIVCADRDLQWAMQTLRHDLRRHLAQGDPWVVCEHLDAIIALDPVAWAVLLALIAECPAIHAAIGASRVLSVDPRSIRFAACNADIAAARGWLETLPARLSG